MEKGLKDILSLSSSRYVIMALSAVRNLVLARALDPGNYGYWIILALILGYGDFVHGGLRHAGDREIPYSVGRNRQGEAAEIESVLLGGILLLSAAAFILLSLVGVLGVQGWPASFLVMAGVVIAAEQISRFSHMILRTRREFLLSTKVEAGFEVLRTSLVCGLALRFGIHGALLGFLLAAVLNVVYFGAALRMPPRPLVNIPMLRTLFKTGSLLFLVGLIQLLQFNLDRLIGSFALVPSDLGIYGLAALATQVPIMFSQSLSTIFIPNASEAYGRRNSLEDVTPLFLRLLRTSAVLGPVVAALVFVALKMLIDWFLPAYSLSVSVLEILLPGAMLSVLIPPTSTLLVVVRRTGFRIVLEAAALSGSCVFFWASLTFASGLQAISFGMVAAIIWYSSLSMMGALFPFRLSKSRMLRELAFSYGPSVYAVLLLFGVLPELVGEGRSVRQGLAEFALFLVLYSPILFVGYRGLKAKEIPGSEESPRNASRQVKEEGV